MVIDSDGLGCLAASGPSPPAVIYGSTNPCLYQKILKEKFQISVSYSDGTTHEVFY